MRAKSGRRTLRDAGGAVGVDVFDDPHAAMTTRSTTTATRAITG
jgi:hypothetical protein